MPCRVGITTDLKTRKSYWSNKVNGFKKWRKLREFKNKKEAQDYENWYAKRYKCKAHAGGPETPGTWCAYRFNYHSMKREKPAK